MWYQNQKKAQFISQLRKHAMPTAPVVCPVCDAHLLVDVHQRVGKSGSDPYEEGDEGVALTKCDKCHSFIKIDWVHHGKVMPSYFCYGVPTVVDEQHEQELISNGVPLVVSMESDSEKEFFEFSMIARQAV